MIDPVDAVNLETVYECRANIPNSKWKELNESCLAKERFRLLDQCKQGENPKQTSQDPLRDK